MGPRQLATRNNTTVLYTTARSRPTHWPFPSASCLLTDRESTCRVVRDLYVGRRRFEGRHSFERSASPAVFRTAPCSHHRPTGLVWAFHSLACLHMHQIHYSCHGEEQAAGKAAASRSCCCAKRAKIWTGLQRRLFSLNETIINRRNAPCSIRLWRW
jgi:hypothetical protein